MTDWFDDPHLKESLFYLTTHSKHFIYVIWRQTYGKGLLRGTERKPAVATTWATVFDKQQWIFYMHIQDSTYPDFVIPVAEHWLEREIAQWVQHEGSIRRPIALWTNALSQSYISLPIKASARRSSVVEYPIMARWVVGSIPHDGYQWVFFSSRSNYWSTIGIAYVVVYAILSLRWCI